MNSNFPNKTLLQVNLCQQELVRADVEIKNGISKIQESRGITEVGLNRLCQSVKQDINKSLQLSEQLEALAKEVNSANDRNDLLHQVRKEKEQIDLNVENFRRASFACSQRIDSETRAELLRGSSSARLRSRAATTITDESSKATEGLTLLVSRMNTEVKRSGDTVDSLVHSSEVLRSTDEQLHSMGATIQSSGRLLSKYSRRELTDKILISLASLLFFATVFYIVQKRLFAGRFSLW